MKRVILPCENGSENKLVFTLADDGDIHISLISQNGLGLRNSVRICTADGGGKYPKTRRALLEVMDKAISEGCPTSCAY
jgi:hypothetical protein